MGLGSILQFDGVGLERFLWFDVLGLGNNPHLTNWFLTEFYIWTGQAGFWKYSAFELVCFGKILHLDRLGLDLGNILQKEHRFRKYSGVVRCWFGRVFELDGFCLGRILRNI